MTEISCLLGRVLAIIYDSKEFLICIKYVDYKLDSHEHFAVRIIRIVNRLTRDFFDRN